MFQRQLALLAERNHRLAEQVAAADANDIHVQIARSGVPTASITAHPRPLSLHSNYDPIREADQFADQVLASTGGPHALVGFGFGYHADALFARLGFAADLLIFEHDPRVLRAALAHRELTSLLCSERVHWLGGDPDGALLERLLPLAERLADGCPVLAPPVAISRCPDFIEQVRRLLAEVSAYGAMSRRTSIEQGRQTIANCVGNFRRYAAAESLAGWRDRWHGRPALVVAAGPSLTKNRGLIAQWKGRAPIVAVGAALKQLLAVGAAPDVVVQIDHSELCARQFQGIEPARVAETILFIHAAASPKVLAAWPGRWAMIAHPILDAWTNRDHPSLEIPSAITVAHAAFYLAEAVGADPIILAGQDLSFPDGVYYSSGNALHELWRPELNRFHTVETKEWERLVRRKGDLVPVPGWSGQTIFTDRQLLNYLRQFERDFHRSAARIIDATEGGAAKQGAEPLRLAETIVRFPAEPFPEEWTATEIAAPRSASDIESLIDRARSRVAEFAGAARELSSALRDRMQNSEVSGETIFSLQSRIQNDHAIEYQAALAYAGAAAVEREQRTREIEALHLEDQQLLTAELTRDAVYLDALAAAADAVAALLAAELSPLTSHA